MEEECYLKFKPGNILIFFTKLIRIFLFASLFSIFCLSSLSLILSFRNKEVILFDKNSFLKKNFLDYFNKLKNCNIDFENLTIDLNGFNVFQKKYLINFNINQLSYKDNTNKIFLKESSLFVDFSRIFKINIKNLSINSGNVDFLDKIDDNNSSEESQIRKNFINLFEKIIALRFNEKNIELKKIAVKFKTETFFFNRILLEKKSDSDILNISSDIIYDEQKSKIDITCNVNDVKCNFSFKKFSTELLDVILKQDTDDQLMDIHGEFLLTTEGLDFIKLNLFLQHTKLFFELKDNIKIIKNIDYLSKNLKLKVNNINLNNIKDTVDNLELTFNINNIDKDFDFLTKKILYFLSLSNLDATNAKLKGSGFYKKGIFSDGFDLKFKNLRIKNVNHIDGHFTGKKYDGKLMINSCLIKDILIENVLFTIQTKNIDNIIIDFNLNLKNFLKNQFNLHEEGEIDIPLKFQKNINNDTILIKNSTDLSLKKIIDLNIKDIKLSFGNNNNFQILTDNIKLDINFIYNKNNILLNGTILHKNDKFNLIGDFNFKEEKILFRINDDNYSKLLILEKNSDNLSLQINLPELDGLFVYNLISKLINNNSKNENEKHKKIILDIKIDKIFLEGKRNMQNFICNGSFQNMIFDKNFILNFDLFDETDKSYKFSFDNNNDILIVENLTPLLYSLNKKDIKFCAFKIFKNEHGAYILHVDHFETDVLLIKDSYSNIELVDKRYIKIQKLLVKVAFIYFTFDITFDIKTGKIEKKMQSLSLIK